MARHAGSLAHWLANQMRSLKHANGQVAVALYSHFPNNAGQGEEASREASLGPERVGEGVDAEGEEGMGVGEGKVGGEGGERLGGGQGAVVTFNLVRGDGLWVGHKEVQKVAALSRIELRVSKKNGRCVFRMSSFAVPEVSNLIR